jgi:hypothetical protein
VIEKVVLATLGTGQGQLSAPPARVVEVEVISGMAYLNVREVDEDGKPADDASAEVVVPARSLLRALGAAVEDDEAPTPPGLRQDVE